MTALLPPTVSLQTLSTLTEAQDPRLDALLALAVEERTAAQRAAFVEILETLDPLTRTQVLMDVVLSEQEDLIPLAVASLPATETKGLVESACKFPTADLMPGTLLACLGQHLPSAILAEVWDDWTTRGRTSWLGALATAWQPSIEQAQAWLSHASPARHARQDEAWVTLVEIPAMRACFSGVLKEPVYARCLPQTAARFRAVLRSDHLADQPAVPSSRRRRT